MVANLVQPTFFVPARSLTAQWCALAASISHVLPLLRSQPRWRRRTSPRHQDGEGAVRMAGAVVTLTSFSRGHQLAYPPSQKTGKPIGTCGSILVMYWFTMRFRFAIRLFGT